MFPCNSRKEGGSQILNKSRIRNGLFSLHPAKAAQPDKSFSCGLSDWRTAKNVSKNSAHCYFKYPVSQAI